MNPNSAELIQTLLVPGILIIASSILMFSTNSRYAFVVDRIRFLKEERVRMIDEAIGNRKSLNQRDNLELQLSHLIYRISMIRIIIVSYSASLLFFAVTCVLLAVRSNFEVNGYFWVTISFFFGGLLGMINGVVFSVIEIFKGYRIIHIDISEDNGTNGSKNNKSLTEETSEQ